MDPLLDALSQQGLGQATHAVYELLKAFGEKPLGRPEISELQSRINMHGVLMRAETVVGALARNGYLSIQARAIADNHSWANRQNPDIGISFRLGESENIDFKAPQ